MCNYISNPTNCPSNKPTEWCYDSPKWTVWRHYLTRHVDVDDDCDRVGAYDADARSCDGVHPHPQHYRCRYCYHQMVRRSVVSSTTSGEKHFALHRQSDENNWTADHMHCHSLPHIHCSSITHTTT